MEDRRVLKRIFFLSVLLVSTFSFSNVFAYSAATTHPALTDEIIDFYNYHYPINLLPDAEKQLIIQGSSEEDSPVTRVINHFYDPMYERGLSGVNISAKTWAQNTKLQGAFSGNLAAGISTPLFSADGDYSWERSVYEYVHGNKNRALIGLGHILHLIEDMTVPDHTRDDMHPPAFDFGSPYEVWTSKFTPENVNIAPELISERKQPTLYSSIGEYMEQVAVFSNNHFFSKDTLPFPEAGISSISEEKYPIPDYSMVGIGLLSDGAFQSFGISKVKSVSYKLFELVEKRDIDTGKKVKSFFIKSKSSEELVLQDYWSILSKQAVLHGAGVVKLFFDEVEKEKQTLALYNKNQSWLSKIVPGVIVSRFSKGDFGTSKNLATVSESLPFENMPPEDNAGENIQQSEQEFLPQPVPAEGIANTSPEIIDSFEISETEESSDAGNEDSENEYGIPDPIPVNTPFFGGSGSGPLKIQEAQQAEAEAAATEEDDTPVISITSPDNNALFATSTVTFIATTTPLAVISQDFSNATTSADINGDWTLTLSNFPEGATTIAFTATDEENLSSNPTEILIHVDTVSPAFESLSVLECTFSLVSSACVSASTDIHLSWTSTSTDIAYYGLVLDGAESATTTTASIIATLSNNATTEIEIVAYDTAGNAATSSPQTVEVFETPVVINEIAWAGTQSSEFDEWIELYNRSSYTIDLSRISLVTEDGTPYISLSGTVASEGYYLIERTDDTTTSVTADLTVAFSGTGGGSGLSNDGEVLSLIHALGGQASTTLDTTPALSSCGNVWCGGKASTTPISMERKDADGLGSNVNNWASNNTHTVNSTDAGGNVINGTPRSQNSVSLLSVGYFCAPETTSFEEGGFYTPAASASCTYLSSELSGQRYGDLYRGTVASSTIVTGHSLGLSTSKTETDSYVGAEQGDSYFVAIFEIHSNPELTAFRDYFQTGANPPPHLNYGVINWTYGTAP